MNIYHTIKSTLGLFFAALFLASTLNADIVETKNGSKLTGKITQIGSSTVVLSTDFAGDVKIKQSEIVAFKTEEPINVRLANGHVHNGTLSNASTDSPAGAIMITGRDGVHPTNISQITETWAADAKDPELVKLERHWSFEAGLDINGKTGNKEQIGSAYSFRATLKSSRDVLQLYTGYDRQSSDHEKSADQFRIGGDYQNNFSGRFSWYAREEAGFDHIKAIDLYNTAAVGMGYDFIKNKIDTLTFRAGISHRYENSDTPDTEKLSELGLDFGLVNHLTMKSWSMTNRLSYTPAFSDFGEYHIFHESYVELPMANKFWKFRVGISNDYDSRPSLGLERLDTTYSARLLLNWK